MAEIREDLGPLGGWKPTFLTNQWVSLLSVDFQEYLSGISPERREAAEFAFSNTIRSLDAALFRGDNALANSLISSNGALATFSETAQSEEFLNYVGEFTGGSRRAGSQSMVSMRSPAACKRAISADRARPTRQCQIT